VPAYVIVETDVTDPEQYEKYKAASPGAIAAGGGRFLVRGGELAVLEGDWQPSRLVVLEFKDLAAAKSWYQSEAYQEAKKLREGAAHLRAVAVQGLDQRTGGSSLSLHGVGTRSLTTRSRDALRAARVRSRDGGRTERLDPQPPGSQVMPVSLEAVA
jgi:uncharacterized protein (DUF1330 family)